MYILLTICFMYNYPHTHTHTHTEEGKIDYDHFFAEKIQAKKDDNTYRNFRVLARNAQQFPTAKHFQDPTVPVEEGRDITVWCSNDYMGMSKHPEVIKATV